MNNKAMCSDHLEKSEARIERELWAALLHAEGVTCAWKAGEPLTEAAFTVAEEATAKVPYVWNPAEPEAEHFFADIEQELSLDDWQSDEVTVRTNAFFAHVNQLWSNVTLQDTLTQRFAARVPADLLTVITNRAQQVLASSLSLADQLVQCVQEALPNLAADDLQVLARPLAYAMRGNESPIESTLERIRPVAWEELSEVEQARLSLAIARFALAELEKAGDA